MAAATAERAFQAASAAGSDELAQQIAGRLDLYRQGKPFVETR